MAGLTPIDYAFLILLKAEGGRGVSNAVLNESYGVTLIGKECVRLKDSGLVESDTKGRPYVHTLTVKGRELLDNKLTVTADEPTPTNGKTRRKPNESKEHRLWAALVALHEHHRMARIAQPPVESLSEAAPAVTANGRLDERIRAAYAQLAAAPGAWVSLRRLRPLFTDVSRSELDRALRALLDDADVNLEPEANQKALTTEDRKASVRIGGEDRHLLAIGQQ